MRLFALVLAGAWSALSQAQSGENVPPLPPYGGHAVACSNIEQDFSRVAGGASYDDYWTGRSGYVTSLLVDPANALVVPQSFRDDSEIFGSHAVTSAP